MCNAFGHPAGCTCGWGGDGHLGRRTDGYSNEYLSSYPSTPEYLWRGNQRHATYDSYVNPNARCPVCRAAVFFYQSPFGGRVFFDELGPPWPKHPCTDNSGSHKYATADSMPSAPLSTYRWQLEGWNPFICLGVRKDKTGRTEVKGRIVSSTGEGAENGHLIYAYVQGQDKRLTDVPLFVRDIDPSVGKYEIATYDLSRDGFRLDPVFIVVYVPSPYRPQRDDPEQSGWVVVPLNRKSRKRKRSKTTKFEQPSNGRKVKRKKKAKGSTPKKNRQFGKGSSRRQRRGRTQKAMRSVAAANQSVRSERPLPRTEGLKKPSATIEESVEELKDRWEKRRLR